jgi:hypothetical protein
MPSYVGKLRAEAISALSLRETWRSTCYGRNQRRASARRRAAQTGALGPLPPRRCHGFPCRATPRCPRDLSVNSLEPGSSGTKNSSPSRPPETRRSAERGFYSNSCSRRRTTAASIGICFDAAMASRSIADHRVEAWPCESARPNLGRLRALRHLDLGSVRDVGRAAARAPAGSVLDGPSSLIACTKRFRRTSISGSTTTSHSSVPPKEPL